MGLAQLLAKNTRRWYAGAWEKMAVMIRVVIGTIEFTIACAVEARCTGSSFSKRDIMLSSKMSVLANSLSQDLGYIGGLPCPLAFSDTVRGNALQTTFLTAAFIAVEGQSLVAFSLAAKMQ
jgi:hypothetical protein